MCKPHVDLCQVLNPKSKSWQSTMDFAPRAEQSCNQDRVHGVKAVHAGMHVMHAFLQHEGEQCHDIVCRFPQRLAKQRDKPLKTPGSSSENEGKVQCYRGI